jgi:hypothetical protein
MKEKELWKYFWDNQVAYAKPFDRDLLWVSKEAFNSVEEHFVKEFNIFQPNGSYRSRRGYLFHIHVIDQDEYVVVHQDVGNVATFLPLGIIHLFFDLIPIVVYARIKKVPMNSFFTRPQ